MTHTGTTYDVRLTAGEPQWSITALHPATPRPGADTLGPQAQAVLANPAVRLPVAARADVESGTVSEEVLSAVNALAASHTIDVSILESGHPIDVFGTSRASDHPKGLAVDIWAIEGRPVVDPANYPLVTEVMQAGVALGAYQAGGPVQLSPTSVFFSDDTHHDHIHLGFR